MPYVSPEVIEEVKKLDLLTYLQHYEPDELVHKAKGEYITKTHGSLTISNGLWNWFKGGVGGKNALDYLVKIKNMKFIDAVIYLSKLEHINDLKNDFHENKSNQIDKFDVVELNNGNRATILDTKDRQTYFADIVNAYGITVDRKEITENEISRVIFPKEKAR